MTYTQTACIHKDTTRSDYYRIATWKLRKGLDNDGITLTHVTDISVVRTASIVFLASFMMQCLRGVNSKLRTRHRPAREEGFCFLLVEGGLLEMVVWAQCRRCGRLSWV